MRLYQILSVLLFLAAARAAEESAIVDEGRINVRGKPSLIGEVVTQLERGEKVTVLERITNSTPRPGDPTNWGKIKFPNNTPVWVFAPFVKDGVVSVSRLNVRAGRGENYSVIGRINRGEPVKHIRTVEEWMEIEPPTNAYAFVDLDLLQFEGQPPRQPAPTPPVEVTKTPVTQTPATTVEPAPPVTAQPAVSATPVADVPTNTSVVATTPSTVPEQPTTIGEPEPAITQPPVAAVEPAPAEETQPEPVAKQPEPEPAPATSVAEVPAVEASAPAILPGALPEVAPPIEKRDVPLPKRVVRREGVVRATTSIQAPTWYELVHADTKKRINYLFDENLGVNLKDYRGQRVVVSGEEAIDPRWPNTPILDMQTLDVLPDATR